MQLASNFDKDPLILSTYTCARDAYESWAANDIRDPLPADPIDARQIELCRWQRRNFGDQSDERMTLGVIEEMAECLSAEEPQEPQESGSERLDALGDACVFAGQLAMGNRLAIRPILHLAFVLANSFIRGGEPIDRIKILVSWGVLAQVVLKGAQKVRGLDDQQLYQKQLVGAVACCIAMCAAQCEMTFPEWARLGKGATRYLDSDIHQDRFIENVYLSVSAEVLKRGTGHDAIPKLVVH